MSKVPGTIATTSYVIPLCSACKGKLQRDDQGQWVCLHCANAWMAEMIRSQTRERSMGGVSLPAGVEDVRKDDHMPTFGDAFPNRRARRAARKRGQR